jgi:uncharacterized protein YaaQ
MARSKKLYILLGILVVVCVITMIVSHTEQKKEEIKNSDETILAIPAEDVNSISWETEDVSFAFHRDGTWTYDEDEEFPVDEDKMNTLLGMFEDFGVSFIIENVEDFGQYGLDDPVCTISLETSDQSVKVELGGYSTMDSERYVSIGDGNVYLVKTDPYDSFNIELSDMIDNDEIPDVTNATEIVYTAEESGDVVYDENLVGDAADDVYYLDGESAQKPLDTDNVTSYLRKLTYLSLSDYVTYKATTDDLVTYGLADPELSLVITYKDEDENEQSFELTLGRDEDQKKAVEDAEEDTESTETDSYYSTTTDSSTGGYLRVGQSAIVYSLSSTDYEALKAISYDSLRHKEVFTADFTGIEKMVVTLDDEEYTIQASGDTDNRTYTYLDNEIDISSIKSAVTALTAEEFTSEQSSKKQEIALTLYVNTEDAESIINIALYRYNGSDCLAEINGEPVSLVSRSSVVDLMEAIYAIVLD